MPMAIAPCPITQQARTQGLPKCSCYLLRTPIPVPARPSSEAPNALPVCVPLTLQPQRPPLVPTLFQECTSNGPCLLHQIHFPMSSPVPKLTHTSPTRIPIHTSPCPWSSPEDMAGCLHPGQLVQAGDTWLTEVKVQPSARPTRPNLAPCPPHRHPS